MRHRLIAHPPWVVIGFASHIGLWNNMFHRGRHLHGFVAFLRQIRAFFLDVRPFPFKQMDKHVAIAIWRGIRRRNDRQQAIAIRVPFLVFAGFVAIGGKAIIARLRQSRCRNRGFVFVVIVFIGVIRHGNIRPRRAVFAPVQRTLNARACAASRRHAIFIHLHIHINAGCRALIDRICRAAFRPHRADPVNRAGWQRLRHQLRRNKHRRRPRRNRKLPGRIVKRRRFHHRIGVNVV